jgi:hypothetical protein
MQNNFVAAIEAANANNEVIISNKTISEMNNNIIDFSSVWGEAAVATTAKVDQQVVNDLFHAFMEIPQEVVVTFKNEDGFLKMVVKMNHREKFFRKYETCADAKLVEYMLGAMRGTISGALEAYKAEEHPLEASEVDPRVELFRQFINSPLRCRFDSDFIAGNGDRYVSAIFTIGYRKQVKFCLKRTEEVESIISDAVKAA